MVATPSMPGFTQRFDGLELRLKSGDWAWAIAVASVRVVRIMSVTGIDSRLFRLCWVNV